MKRLGLLERHMENDSMTVMYMYTVEFLITENYLPGLELAGLTPALMS